MEPSIDKVPFEGSVTIVYCTLELASTSLEVKVIFVVVSSENAVCVKLAVTGASFTLATCWEAEVNVVLPPTASVVVTWTNKYLSTIDWSEGIVKLALDASVISVK